MDGLGIIQGNTRGLVQHNMLLLSERGLPLGLLQQHSLDKGRGTRFSRRREREWQMGKGIASDKQECREYIQTDSSSRRPRRGCV
jgi:hypothetical protein